MDYNLYFCSQVREVKEVMELRRFLLFIVWGYCISMWSQAGLFFTSDKLSNTNITSICQDKSGYIWIGTENGLNRFDGYKFTIYRNIPNDSTSLMFNIVNKVFCDNSGHLWVGTNHGLQRYDDTTDSFVNYGTHVFERSRISDICQLPNGDVVVGTAGYGLFKVEVETQSLKPLEEYKANADDKFFGHFMVDADGTLWKDGHEEFGYIKPGQRPQLFSDMHDPPMAFADANGKVLIMNRKKLCAYDNGQFLDDYFDMSEVSAQNPHFWTVMRDRIGNIYIGTRGNGLLWIPRGSRKVQRYVINVTGININTSTVQTIFEDRQGNFWVGCWHKGLLVIPANKAQFTSWSFSRQKCDIGNYVSSLCQGTDGMIWCTVRDEGVYGFNADGQLVAHPAAPAWVEFIDRDTKGNYYVGAGTNVYSYNPYNGHSQQLLSYSCNMINDMADDGRGHLFFSVFGRGILRYDTSSGDVMHYSQNNQRDTILGRLVNDWIMSMTADRNGRIWLATTNGVSCYDSSTDSFRPFGWNAILEGKRCESLCETSLGDMLIGTMEGLYVWRRSTGTVEEFPDDGRLKGLTIGYIVQDQVGDIWCSTSMGIWHYRMSDGEWVSHVSGSGLIEKEYIPNAGLYIPNKDCILFATSDGITSFTPQQVQERAKELGEIKLTNLFFGGQPVSTDRTKFSFPYKDNVISMEFSLMNFLDAANTVFEYRLSHKSEWMRIGEGQNTITFTHLPIGTYELEVRAIVGGVISAPQVYTITIEAPWYRSLQAYILYIIGLIVMVCLLGILWRRWMQRQMYEDKMKFLINATHDIRSPLTLIMSPLEKLKNEKIENLKSIEELQAFNSSVYQPSLKIIDGNARRIMNLVNQILDIRKIDKQQMSLTCRETNLCTFLKRICQYYEYNARERDISFTYTVPEEPVVAWIDRSQFEKVIANLLSNAFKYTYDHGSIDVAISTGQDVKAKGPLENYIELSVTDSGTGMSEDTLKHLFDRFYQGKSSSASYIEGTGIGLNLCKMIVDMHHGTITARNRENGYQGSVFTVRLPQGHDHLKESEITEQEETDGTITQHPSPNTHHHVLLVDDDEELARYVAEELGQFYKFTICHNGREGFRELIEHKNGKQQLSSYDIVISDIMMPEMDGFTLLRLIKSNSLVSHIPVILLTSKSDVGNRLEGLKNGADAYLTKPFVMSELQLTIDNLVSKTAILREKVKKARLTEKYIEDIEVKGNDELLMERVLKCINDNIGNNDLDVNLICREAGISRSQLHRKMKEMLGLSVHDFIQNIRMEQAARMLVEQKLNITQVAYTVGYSSLSSFSVAFRKHFSISPTDYISHNH